ncbi:MAG TPA: selenocysteine-specific translation elongation factor [Pyrinomonadaceae bacterium]|nr:selenocysteine-specific translation elongation factor [Pyrinomonadaceae bacterium]
MKSIIVGTAGHIDHGKTALVRALTGVDADRLPEEKRRGITIDIGFADLDLEDVHIGFVDVPGHERFVKNMLAGAHGIDVVALVIAADESVMPQTREHFDICRLLGVSKGVVVLTKKDLVDDELLALARAEAEELVQGSFLAGAPLVAVSSRTGEGIPELKQTLRQLALEVNPRSHDFVTRLPIDRAFTMKGFGAVVTGTLISGQISEGDDLELLPAGSRVRVRGIQVHGSAVKQALAGQRTAINLGGVDATALARGMVLAPPGRVRATQVVDVGVQVLDNSPRALRSRQRVRVHVGAAEVLARVRVLESEGQVPGGGRGLAQLRFEAPIVAALGDRFILRAYSPQTTIGGGVILDPFAARHRARDFPLVRTALADLAGEDKTAQLIRFVTAAGAAGFRREAIAARTAWRDDVIAEAAAQATRRGAVMNIEENLVAGDAFAAVESVVVAEVTGHHKREPLARGLSKEILRERFFAGVGPEVFRAMLAELEKRGAVVTDKEIVRLREHTRELSPEDARARDSLEQIFRAAGVAPPSLGDAFAKAGLNASPAHARRILQLLIDSGALVKVHGEMFFHRTALDELSKRLRAQAAKTTDRAIDVGGFKDLAGISRKYAIPLLEYFDRQRVTRREGERRIVL